MNKKLKWIKFQMLKRKPVSLMIISLLTAMLFIQATSNQADEIISKTRSIIDDRDGVMKAFTAVRTAVGGDFPCGFAMGIALEDFGRYIFSAQSGFLATTLPDSSSHILPSDTTWTTQSGKVAETMNYQSALYRTKKLKIGTFDGTYGKRWSITDEQATDFYDQVHTVNLGGEIYTAFDQNNMFYEGLISTQILIKKTEEQAASINDLIDQNQSLIARLELIERELNINNSLPDIGKMAISPNPGKTNMITVDYQLFQEVNNASFVIIDMQGRLIYKVDLENSQGNLRVDNNLPAGTYLCYLYNNSFQSTAKKLIIQ